MRSILDHLGAWGYGGAFAFCCRRRGAREIGAEQENGRGGGGPKWESFGHDLFLRGSWDLAASADGFLFPRRKTDRLKPVLLGWHLELRGGLWEMEVIRSIQKVETFNSFAAMRIRGKSLW